jgi:TATA-box binding protein (TBP) (component of TFIID and TFIIIB)
MDMGIKRPEREADHSSPLVPEVKNEWSYTSVPSMRLHGVHKKGFIFISRKVRCTGAYHSKQLDHEIQKFITVITKCHHLFLS